jgi:putative peptide zinc metalloprotease protein
MHSLLEGPARKVIVALIAVAVAVSTGLVVRAAGGGGSPDNAAVAVNTNDGSERYRLSFKISRTNADTVDPVNAAVAVSSCADCQTVAIAIQAVIVWEDPSVVSPTNLALAINQNCELCLTYADARQHVIGTDGVARFTAEGNQRIAAIRRQLQAIRTDDLTLAELQARVDELSAELADVLRDELVVASRAASGSPSPSASPTASGSAGTTADAIPDESGT